MYATASYRQAAFSSIGAIVMTVAVASLSSSPVHASTATVHTVPAWQASVNRSIDSNLQAPSPSVLRSQLRSAAVTVHFDEAGQMTGAELAQSSGVKSVDAEALRTAKAVSYPTLPAGAPRTVTMKLFFGPGADEAYDNVVHAQLTRR